MHCKSKKDHEALNCEAYVPKWPMKAVSIREAMGSAATAKAAGNAIPSNSRPMESILNTFLHPPQHSSLNKSTIPDKYNYNHYYVKGWQLVF